MSKKPSSLLALCMATLLLFAPSTNQADLSELTVSEFDHSYSSLSNTLVFFLNSRLKASQRFINDRLPAVLDLLAKQHPQLRFLKVDVQRPGTGLKGDPLFFRHNVYLFPTVRLYMKGVGMNIQGLLTAAHISNVVSKKLAALPVLISTSHGIDKLDKTVINLIYYTTNDDIKSWLETLAQRFNFFTFAQVNNLAALEDYAKKNNAVLDLASPLLMVMRVPHDPNLPVYNDRNPSIKSILRFIHRSRHLSWTYFSNSSLKLIEESLNSIVLFLYDSEEDNAKQLSAVKELSEKSKGDRPTLLIHRSNTNGIEFLESLGFDVPSKPTLFVITRKHDAKFNKYILDEKTEINLENLNEFVADCEEDKYPKHYKSEALPSKRLYPNVEPLVGSNIDEKVFFSEDKHHLVFFYTSLSVNQLPHFQKLAEKLKHESIGFYMFDHEHNESLKVKDKFEDSIVLYSKLLKVEKVFHLVDDFDGKGIGDFLKKHMAKDTLLNRLVEGINFTADL